MKTPDKSTSFIKFLWHEFMLGCDYIIDQNESSITPSNNQPSAKDIGTDWQWSSAVKSRELIKVLAVKMPEDVADFSKSKETDREVEQINDWQKIFADSRQKIISYQPANSQNHRKNFVRTIKNLSIAIKEMKTGRQEKKWQRQSEINSLFAYLTGATFVTAIFFTIVLPPAAYSLAGFSDRLAVNIMSAVNSKNQIQQSLPLFKFSQTQLADFIRINSNKFPVDYFNGHTTIILSKQDILGLSAGATELNQPTPVLAPNIWSSGLAKLINLEQRFLAAVNKNFYNLFSK